jgi:predicted kinase
MANKNFTSWLSEAKGKGAVFTFGRFNPPTTGHAKLVDRLQKVAKGYGDALLFSSHSNDKVKNPLSHKDKVKYLKAFFGKQVNVIDADVKQIFQILTFLHDKGYTKIRMVVGSDRVREFDTIIKKYNSVKGRHGFYKFDEIQIVSAGERDPDADDVSGMSASKMREFAEKGDFESFKEGVPKTGQRFAQKLYKDIRKGMGLTEDLQHLPQYMVEDLITEGVYDPGIFKAVFLMGGPGSGKSTVVDQLNLVNLGLKIVNTDKAFENGLKKAGLGLDLRNMDADLRDPIRSRAKEITAKQMDAYLRGRLGMVFDTTGAKASKIVSYKNLLDKAGYEYKMVFVNTSLDFAQQRNSERARKLPKEVVTADWNASQKNVDYFRKLFKKDFIEILNNDDHKALIKKSDALYGKMLTWTSKFPANKQSLAWKEAQLLAKRSK